MSAAEHTLSRPHFAARPSLWSSLAFRGAVSVVVGAAALASPGITLATLIVLFGAYAFVDGIAALVAALQGQARSSRVLYVLDGLLGVGAGLIALFWPAITLLALVLVVGVRFVAMGVFQVAAAIKRGKDLGSPLL